MSVLFGCCHDTIDEFLGFAFEFSVHTVLLQTLHCFDTSRHGQGVAGESPCLVHGTRWCDHFHNILAASVSPNGKTTPNHFSHGCDIGRDAEVFLGTSVGHAESCHDLIEHQQGAVLLGHFPQSLQEFLVGFDEARVTHNWFKDDSGNLVLVFFENLFDGFQVIIGGTVGGRGGRCGHTRRIGQSECGNTGSSLDQERISVTVVASLEFDHLFTASKCAHQADHSHTGFSS
mmetsp:Transcript_4870/g.10941  ORF Transcript_4870/g.10941 Transcript_4870/m.10941 type:complete len:231 (-) Transcript_4870:84-776(-)